VWALSPHQVIKPGAILAKGAGATVYMLLEGDDTPVLPHHRLAHHPLQSCTRSTWFAVVFSSRYRALGVF